MELGEELENRHKSDTPAVVLHFIQGHLQFDTFFRCFLIAIQMPNNQYSTAILQFLFLLHELQEKTEIIEETLRYLASRCRMEIYC